MLDEVRDTHDRVVITRNGRPEAVIMSVSDLEALEDTLDLLSTPGALDEIWAAEAEVARGEAIGADELRRQMAQRMQRRAGRRVSDEAYALSLAPSARRVLVEGPPRGLPLAVAAAVTEFLTGALLDNPHRVGKPLTRELRRLPFRASWRLPGDLPHR